MKKLLLLSLLVLMTIAIVPASEADRGFTVADIRGNYGFSFTGSAPLVGAVAATGWFNADGAGMLRDGFRASSLGGVIIRESFTCRYDVAPRGIATATCWVDTVEIPDGIPDALRAFLESTRVETFVGVIVGKRSDEIPFIARNPGTVIEGTVKKQGRPGDD